MELYATELMGVKAYDAQGNYVGRVREFFIEPAEAPNRISHFLLSRGRFQPLVAKHNQIAAISEGKIQLNVGEKALEIYQPNESWLAVQKDLSASERQSIIASLDEETAAGVLGELDARLTTQIVEDLDPEKAADILEEMAPDAAADLLADLPKETSEELLEEMPGREAEEVRELLEFDPATAGGMMNTEFVFVSENATRDEVLEWLRKQDHNHDQLDTIVLLDDKAQYSGVVPVVRMLLAVPGERLAALKMEPLVSLPPEADEKEVFQLFDKYNLRMLTVVDKDKRPVGAITVDDVVSRLVKS